MEIANHDIQKIYNHQLDLIDGLSAKLLAGQIKLSDYYDTVIPAIKVLEFYGDRGRVEMYKYEPAPPFVPNPILKGL